jgi:hypothetical protein
MKTLVVYHHVPIREALRGVLKELRNDITVLEAADSRETMRLIEEHPECTQQGASETSWVNFFQGRSK